jgi:hypothetical protein
VVSCSFITMKMPNGSNCDDALPHMGHRQQPCNHSSPGKQHSCSPQSHSALLSPPRQSPSSVPLSCSPQHRSARLVSARLSVTTHSCHSLPADEHRHLITHQLTRMPWPRLHLQPDFQLPGIIQTSTLLQPTDFKIVSLMQQP